MNSWFQDLIGHNTYSNALYIGSHHPIDRLAFVLARNERKGHESQDVG